jgi:hypothetical protein
MFAYPPHRARDRVPHSSGVPNLSGCPEEPSRRLYAATLGVASPRQWRRKAAVTIGQTPFGSKILFIVLVPTADNDGKTES